MKRLQIASALFVLVLTGIAGIAFVSRPDSAQVIEVTPLDQGDTTPTYSEYPTAEALICEGDCACWFYSFEDTDGTQVVMAECGQVAERTTATPPVIFATPTAVADGPTLTPTIEKVIGRYCFTGTTSQNIRSGPDSDNAVIGRLFPQQCLEILTVNSFPNGDMWLRSFRGWVAYRVNGKQYGNFVQIVN